jgi:putative ubiquitin-RnfH superfamily antitoxin RatB of RatAB toxin-antitoxin module
MMDFPELELEEAKIGVFGKATAMTTVLNEGDRVEIYRPLIADPKEVRRKRAAEGKKMKKGGDSSKSEK